MGIVNAPTCAVIGLVMRVIELAYAEIVSLLHRSEYPQLVEILTQDPANHRQRHPRQSTFIL